MWWANLIIDWGKKPTEYGPLPSPGAAKINKETLSLAKTFPNPTKVSA